MFLNLLTNNCSINYNRTFTLLFSDIIITYIVISITF